jgi:hypothetical protein
MPKTPQYVSIDASDPAAIAEIETDELEGIRRMQNEVKHRHYWSAHFWAMLDVAVFTLGNPDNDSILLFHNSRVKWWASDDGIEMGQKLFGKMDWESVLMPEELESTPRKDSNDH